eukprot:SM000015S01174  [mRNA]  locus=s15:254979:257948:+ [translate_table: standard]
MLRRLLAGGGGGARRGSAMSSAGGGRSALWQDLLLYAVSGGLSLLCLFVGLRQMDPNRATTKLAAERKREIAARLGRPWIQTNTYEDVIACDVINPESIEATFDSIGGLDAVKAELHELVILPLQRPELFAHGKLLRPQRGVLLYGPPGTGKTMLAKAIAKESQAAFINVRMASLLSKWFGDSQKLVTAVFTLAHKLQPSIIFIDEVDGFLGQRRQADHEAMNNMKTEFMALWDGFTTDEMSRVMVLAATNRPWELDEAILRRLPRHFEVGMPDAAQRMSILRVILKASTAPSWLLSWPLRSSTFYLKHQDSKTSWDESVDPKLNLHTIAERTEGYSGSDLTDLCKQAAYYPLRDFLDLEREAEEWEEERNRARVASFSRPEHPARPRPLRQSDFDTVLSSSKTSKDAALAYSQSRGAMPHANGWSSGGLRNGSEAQSLTISPEFLKMMMTMGAMMNGAVGGHEAVRPSATGG